LDSRIACSFTIKHFNLPYFLWCDLCKCVAGLLYTGSSMKCIVLSLALQLQYILVWINYSKGFMYRLVALQIIFTYKTIRPLFYTVTKLSSLDRRPAKIIHKHSCSVHFSLITWECCILRGFHAGPGLHNMGNGDDIITELAWTTTNAGRANSFFFLKAHHPSTEETKVLVEFEPGIEPELSTETLTLPVTDDN